jgi:hypothetical protein
MHVCPRLREHMHAARLADVLDTSALVNKYLLPHYDTIMHTAIDCDSNTANEQVLAATL